MFLADFMRMLNTIFSALSLFLLLVVAFFWARSYWRFDGILRYSEGTPITLETSLKGRTFKVELPGRSAGLISYRGQMAYVSVATPIGEPWESWSVPVEATTGTGPAALVSDVRVHTGLRYGSDQTRSELLDPTAGFSWHLPYRYLVVPYWMPAILLGVMPWRWLAGYRLALVREKQGLCVRCGASVRGLLGNCPKCGEAID
jgi:hypothetical protein